MPDELHSAGRGEGHGGGPVCPPPSPPCPAPSPFRPSFLPQPSCLGRLLQLTDRTALVSLDLCHFVPMSCPCFLCPRLSPSLLMASQHSLLSLALCHSAPSCHPLAISPTLHGPPRRICCSPLRGLCHPPCSNLTTIKKKKGRKGTSWFPSGRWSPGGLWIRLQGLATPLLQFSLPPRQSLLGDPACAPASDASSIVSPT